MPELTLRVHSPSPDEVIASLGPIPGVRVTRAPAGGAEASALIAFDAPDDEDISRYDWIHVGGAGPDRIFRALKDAPRLPLLTRTIGAMGRQMAEYVLAYILADLQKMALRRAFEAQRSWQKDASLPTYLFDQRIAILGTGAIGGEIAAALAPLCRGVTGYSRSGRHVDGFDAVRPLGDFEAADIVIVALPATPETEGLVGERLFTPLDEALFLNIGRGAVVDEGALRKALDRGNVRHAVLDVFTEEPLPPTDWAWTDDRVTVTPHVSGVTRPTDIAAAFRGLLPSFRRRTLASSISPARGY